jgi:hypothetical protein
VSVSAGWFALGGVVICGLLNGFVSWLLARVTMRSSARVAALLVSEELMQSWATAAEIDKQRTWGAVLRGHEFGKRTAWDENRATLGHALTSDGYMSIAAAYSGLAQAVVRAGIEDRDTPIGRATTRLCGRRSSRLRGV